MKRAGEDRAGRGVLERRRERTSGERFDDWGRAGKDWSKTVLAINK